MDNIILALATINNIKKGMQTVNSMERELLEGKQLVQVPGAWVIGLWIQRGGRGRYTKHETRKKPTARETNPNLTRIT